tara:strand:+ start:761 stop:1324 length:564 start_codon:yes stop_codon:yes gene_type:complete
MINIDQDRFYVDFNTYYIDTRAIFTERPIIKDIFNESINPNDDESIDMDIYSDLILKNKKYYNELQFYRLIYYDYYQILEKVRNKLKTDRVYNESIKFSNSLKKKFGNQYSDLLELSKEYGFKLEDTVEYLNLPEEKDYKRFKRNITKKFNKLQVIGELDKRDKAQIESLKNYNLVKFKKVWIDTLI